MRVFSGTDIGGTFTDVVGFDAGTGQLSFGKRLTNRDHLVDGIVEGLADIGLQFHMIDTLKHGTTQVINTLLERKGAPTALVTTAGFRDMLEIGRAGRPIAFDLNYQRQAPLVQRDHCLEISERIDSKGNVLQPVEPEELEALAETLRNIGVQAVAISFLNAFVNPDHEMRVADFLRRELPHLYVSAGTELSREWYEYERTSTAVANAYIGPRARDYLEGFRDRLAAGNFSGLFYMMGSNGGVLPLDRSIEQPVALVESGPIGGCVGAALYATRLEIDRMVAFDMGGTTAKCAIVEGGLSEVQETYYVGGYERGIPLRTPVLDIVEVGTGGGSIAGVDGQRLRVGPESAGSYPGPVCFRNGGTRPTVTDVNLVLGRISGGRFLNGQLPLDHEASRSALEVHVCRPLGYTDAEDLDKVAAGILTLANAQMAMAIKEITIERGQDIRDFTLFVFGGGGPLHGSDLARELRIPRVVVPPEPGNFSALGMLFADARTDESRSIRVDVVELAASPLQDIIRSMKDRAGSTLREEVGARSVAFELVAEIRFRGQKHSLRIPFVEDDGGLAIKQRFFDAYRKRYGHVDEHGAVEIIGIRVSGLAETEKPDIAELARREVSGTPDPESWRDVYFSVTGRRERTAIYQRECLPIGFEARGPAIIEEFGSTIVVGPDDLIRVGGLGELTIEISS